MDESKEHRKAKQELDWLVGDLMSLSRAFQDTGNSTVSKRLGMFANRLAENSETMDKAFWAMSNRFVDAVNQGSDNMYQTALSLSQLIDQEGR